MTGKAAKAYVTACLLVFAVSLCLLVYQGRKGVQAEEASDLSAETAAGQGNYLQYDASLEENTLLMQLPEGVTQQDIELQSDCMAEKVTIRLRKEVGGKQLDRRYFQEHPIRQNISLAESERRAGCGSFYSCLKSAAGGFCAPAAGNCGNGG